MKQIKTGLNIIEVKTSFTLSESNKQGKRNTESNKNEENLRNIISWYQFVGCRTPFDTWTDPQLQSCNTSKQLLHHVRESQKIYYKVTNLICFGRLMPNTHYDPRQYS